VRKEFFFTCLIFTLCSCSGRYLLHSSFQDSPVPPSPDYSNENNWAVLPWKKNLSDSTPGVEKVSNRDTSQVDVFFVHPTTFTKKPKNQYKWNADVNDSQLNRKTDETTILYQASVFNQSCNIYAPRYRQAQISSFSPKRKTDGREALDLAYSDVKKAFTYYLGHYNNGRPFIIASHSQGTFHAERLMKDFLSDTVLQQHLVAAYLIGFPINADSLSFIKPCNSPNETDCYCTWNTFAYGYYPSFYDYGLNNAICTNPLSWTTDTLYCLDTLNRGGVLLNFQKVYPAICDAQVHAGMLWINKPNIPLAKFYRIKTYHVGDINLFYFNIRENVAARISAYMKNSALLDSSR